MMQRSTSRLTLLPASTRPPRHTMLAALLGLSLLAPMTSFAQSDDEKRAAMNAAYRQYQEIVAQGPQFREQSIEPAREAYELALDVLGDANPTTAALAINYGNALTDGDDAADILEHALEISENVHGDDALELIDPLMALANSATAHGEFADARDHYERAFEIAQAQEQRDPILEAIIGVQLGTTSFSMGRLDEARDYFIGARDKLQPIDNDVARIRLATANFWIGRYEISAANYLGAIAPLQASAEVFDAIPEARQFSVNSHIALVEAYERQGQRDQATPHALFVGQDSTAPTLIYRPAFPGELWREGEITLRFDVDAEGFVTNVSTADGDADAELVTAASEAVTAVRYAPRFENGSAVATSGVTMPFRFSRPGR